ncbi:hypothetical protein GCM10023335_56030 [Streptomyces siamensis]|uniref:Transposase n=1 Tax=Streptomyces siamensis TaxID=1274986 RepID=A0ABP9J9X3_9ACTN
MTPWRRLRDRTEVAVWLQLHEVLLTELRASGLLDIDDVAIDGSHVRALKRGQGQARHVTGRRATSSQGV